MTRVGIVGATGYAGAELVRLLAGHPEVALTLLTSRQYAGVPFQDIYPAFSGVVDLPCEAFDPDTISDKTDIVFTALPHKLPMEIVPGIVASGKKVIDLSADFRFSDPDVYEAAYTAHTAKELLGRSVYGLSEVFADRIKNADITGNPGCYPTSVLLPLIPLLTAGILVPESIVADSKSGVSGAGRALSLGALYSEVSESFKAYKVAAHRHEPEMEAVLSAVAGFDVNITFVPHLLPMNRGMETTIYAGLSGDIADEEIYDRLSDYYAGRRFIRISKDGRPPDTRNVRGTNYCDIAFVVDRDHRRLILMSVLDNLVKGASGQAVQNMNIMLGLEETTGLDMTPFPL